MLMVTKNAGQAIESIVANAEMPDGSGLRIDAPDEPSAPDGSGVALQLQVASQPAEQDQVVSEGGAKVARRCSSRQRGPDARRQGARRPGP
jgi:Fe-S cluster assembly iron-binding protein IscA